MSAISCRARIIDPITSSAVQTIFDIKPEGDSWLNSDVKLVLGTVITGVDLTTRYNDRCGGFGLIRQLTVRDQVGRTLFDLQEVGRYATFALLRQANEDSLEFSHLTGENGAMKITNEDLSQVDAATMKGKLNRSVIRTAYYRSGESPPQVLANPLPPSYTLGKYWEDPIRPTTDPTTTPMMLLDLRKICDLIDGRLLPLGKMGTLRFIITWENTITRIYSGSESLPDLAAGSVAWVPPTAFYVYQPQLVYNMISGIAPGPEKISIVYESPRLSVNQISNVAAGLGTGIGTVNQQIGFAGQLVNRLLIDVSTDVGVYDAVLGSSYGLNFKVNGSQVYPQRLSEGSILNQLQQTFGQLMIPAGAYGNSGYPVSSGCWQYMTSDWIGVDLKPVKTSGKSTDPTNTCRIDSSGISMELQRRYGNGGIPVRQLYTWAFNPRVISIGPMGVLDVQ